MITVTRKVCVTCNTPAYQLRKGVPCPGCGEMTTVVSRQFLVEARGPRGTRQKSSGRRSDRGDSGSDPNLF